MTRPARITLYTVSGLFALLLILGIVGVFVAQSGWFREKVRERIVAEVETATGGRAEVGKFRFDWHTLTAELDDFVIHGTEPGSGPPLLRAKRVIVGLKVVSLLKRDIDIALLEGDTPQAYLLIYPDNRTNIPEPKIKSAINKTAAETILDLAIGTFNLKNGSITVQAQGKLPKVTPWSAVGQNLNSKLTYDKAGPRYGGDISMQPLQLKWGAYEPLPLTVKLSATFDKTRLKISSGHLATAFSQVDLSGTLENFADPRSNLTYDARLSLDEIGRVLKLRSRQSGTVQLGGSAQYTSAADYRITGNLHARDVNFRQGSTHVEHVRADSSVTMDPQKIQFEGLRVAALGGTMAGRAELRDFDRYHAEGKLDHFDLRTVAALFTAQQLPWDGMMNGPFELTGRTTTSAQQASARINISPAGKGAPVHGLIDAKYDSARGGILQLAKSYIALPATRLDLSGTLGQQLQIHLVSHNLDDLLPAIRAAATPGRGAPPVVIPVALNQGAATFDGTVTGPLASPVISGHLTGQNVVYSGETITSLAGDLTAQKTGAKVQNASVVYKNMRAQFQGSVGLRNWKPEDNQPLTASLALQNSSVADLLTLAGQSSVPVTGTLSTTANVTGTIGNPRANADLTIVNGSVYGEPFDRISANVTSNNNTTQAATAQITAGPKQINAKATFDHAATDFLAGRFAFQVSSNRMAIAQFETIRKMRPDAAGTVQLTATGQATVAHTNKGTEFHLADLNADANATGIQFEGKALGDARLTAKTQGDQLTANLDSDAAHANIHGQGQWRLSGAYPGGGQVTFSKVDLASVRTLFLPPTAATQNIGIGGSVEGKVTFNGPALTPAAWNGALEIQQLLVKPVPARGYNPSLNNVSIQNSGPIRISMNDSVIHVDSAQLVGTANNVKTTNISVTGQVALNHKSPLDLHVDSTLDLGLLQSFNPDIVSSGNLIANASIRGAMAQPQLSGRMELKNANLNMINVPNGLSNANGIVLFDGSRATIQTLTADSGGGKIRATGFAAFVGGKLSFRMQAIASQVRVRYPEGVSTVADATLNYTGTTDRSLLAGDIMILRTSFNPKTDLGSVLSSSAGPVRTASTQTGLLGGLQFDVQIQTSPDISFQTGVAQDLQAEANLKLRGSVTNPILLGRINITQGDLTFFGNKYVINQGTIAFYNPVKLEPILNIDLETRARGVDVTLTVSGPITKLNVSYRSDPPLQFSDIVALLATGRAPSDPSLAARENATPQSWQQLGASALVSQAIANPVAGRLQRFFGVSKLKIDPLLSGVAGTAGNLGARLTIEQQVTPDITFTYITNITSTNPQVVRVEWAFSKNWSAVALREENSQFGIDFLYKKRFK